MWRSDRRIREKKRSFCLPPLSSLWDISVCVPEHSVLLTLESRRLFIYTGQKLAQLYRQCDRHIHQYYVLFLHFDRSFCKEMMGQHWLGCTFIRLDFVVTMVLRGEGGALLVKRRMLNNHPILYIFNYASLSCTHAQALKARV